VTGAGKILGRKGESLFSWRVLATIVTDIKIANLTTLSQIVAQVLRVFFTRES